MDESAIEQFLKSSAQDGKLSRAEKAVLRSIVGVHAPESHDRDRIRNHAFQIALEKQSQPGAKPVLTWLEDVLGILVMAERPVRGTRTGDLAEVHFSPGNDCRNRIRELLRDATTTVDICVFTITDDRITDSIIDAHARGVAVRVISDDDKAQDKGSDLSRLENMNIHVAYDRTADHMHHKFAIFDRHVLVSGSYNWTRAAAEDNEENIIVSSDNRLVLKFANKFDELWRRFSG